MENKINVFDIEFDRLTAKQVMRQMLQYMESESVSTVDIVALESLMQGQDNAEWKEWVHNVDLLLPGSREILESVGITDGREFQDMENHTFFRLFFRYLERNQKTVFLLAEQEQTLDVLKDRIDSLRRGTIICGEAVLSPDSENQDKVINQINGVEPDCIMSVLSCPYQEQFISENKALLNARVWLGCGPLLQENVTEKRPIGRLKRFILKKSFRHQVDRQNKETDFE